MTLPLPPRADALLRTSSRKAVAIALNYAAHAAEMHSSLPVPRAAPYWFFKPSTSYLPPDSGPALLPEFSTVHHEVELGVVIGKRATDVPRQLAHKYILGYICAIDLTARNWQTQAKEMGRPWSIAKGCDTFLPYSTLVPADAIPLDKDTGVADVNLYLDVNGERRQSGSTKDMIWTVPELIEHVSSYVTLEEWDLLLTGTPEGVGELNHGDVVTAGIQGIVDLKFDVVRKAELRSPDVRAARQ